MVAGVFGSPWLRRLDRVLPATVADAGHLTNAAGLSGRAI